MAKPAKIFKYNPASVNPQAPAVDIAAYPILTEEVGYPPSPISKPSALGGATPVPGSAPLGQIVVKAMSDVLGWRVKPGDTKGFVGALTQSFTLTEVEGHVESKWTPRTYAVQTDLAGGITGAQASIYSRGKDALNQALPLLDGIYALDPEANGEDVTALKAVVKGQLTELVNELGFMGGPRVSRVNQYFGLLLMDSSGGSAFPPTSAGALPTDPDQVGGTLGNLREELGLNFTDQDFVNSVEDEQNLSNYRILSDYVTSLAVSWINNVPFFGLNPPKPFYGTQLVWLSRQLSVVAESVDQVRFTLDSVFIGPAERQTMQMIFPPPLPSIYLEDLLSWVQGFASTEGPGLIQDGGKFAVHNTFYPIVKQLQAVVAKAPGVTGLPKGFYTARVHLSLIDLASELNELVRLAQPIEHEITAEPDSLKTFAVNEVGPLSLGHLPAGSTSKDVPIFVQGTGFQVGASVDFLANTGSGAPPRIVKNVGTGTFFQSENILVVRLQRPIKQGTWDVKVTNADGTKIQFTDGLVVTS